MVGVAVLSEVGRHWLVGFLSPWTRWGPLADRVIRIMWGQNREVEIEALTGGVDRSGFEMRRGLASGVEGKITGALNGQIADPTITMRYLGITSGKERVWVPEDLLLTDDVIICLDVEGLDLAVVS